MRLFGAARYIPGAYWATVRYPATTHAVIGKALGEVHMLSLPVGAANRADIRRLRQFEEESAELRGRLDRQQAPFARLSSRGRRPFRNYDTLAQQVAVYAGRA